MADSMVGKSLPTVSLESSAGGKVQLPQDLKGKWTILYFYPKDDTPGCTRQACAYRDNMAEFKSAGIQVLGVSLDDLTSHDSFITKFSLNFPLLADVKRELSEGLGVYGEQKWGDKTYMGLSRDSFLIDPNGRIVEAWRKVNADATMKETLEAARRHMG